MKGVKTVSTEDVPRRRRMVQTVNTVTTEEEVALEVEVVQEGLMEEQI